jgi:oxygen-independent coproporphyrinogen-3 oxidase
MAGIYIHVPYCKKACHYCNFHFSTTRYQLPEMADAIAREAVLRSNYISEPVATIYWGGGTPSLFPAGTLQHLLEVLHRAFTIEAGAEITLEANPDDITPENLMAWRQLGINRLSIGIQSFFEEDLAWMNRAHNAVQAREAIVLAQAHGFHNLTIDLIYGTPTLTNDRWLENLEITRLLQVPHVSCYALTVEPKTALDKLIAVHKVPPVDTERQSVQFDLLMDWAAANGWEHYEISNLAKPGYRSRHNSSYWQGKPYLGLGPSAHSFNGPERQWNIANNPLYIKAIQGGELPFEKEVLTGENQLNEYIMTSLRTMEGLDLSRLSGEVRQHLQREALPWMEQGKLVQQQDRLVLTRKGKHYADGIAAGLFV